MNKYTELKMKFFEFFSQKGYQKINSSNLIIDDPNLLFTVAGMVQFKDIFLKNIPKVYNRVVTIQKCLRVGGKHNDLDNVGFTKRHNTFFEMMGHFAFQDDTYSKEKIIQDAVNFLLDVGLNLNQFWVTIDHKDEECYEIWQKIIPENRIIKELSGENFWSMGDEGPCGFCTEILYDREYNPREILTGQDVLKNSERFLEVWNIVSMTKIKTKGVIMDTPGLSIDTGMGLERLLSIIENVDNNFETSSFLPIINKIKKFIPNGPDHLYKICADHIRTIVFLLAEDLVPSGEKQGYVLKKIIRRAIFYYHGYYKEPLLYKLIPVVQDLMGSFYPEIYRENMDKILYQEELKIIDHLENNENIIKKHLNDSSKTLDGNTMFFLYDTLGINMNMLEDYAQVHDISLDYEGFNKSMDQQKFQSGQKIIINDELDGTLFVGQNNYYQKDWDYGCNIVGIYDINGNTMDTPQDKAIIITDKTWFFPESCGQIGDTGHVIINNKTYKIINTLFYPSLNQKIIGHVMENPEKDSINLQKVIMKVDYDRRINIARNHTATHLLNQAFNEIIGPGDQRGSWVGNEKFRWDVGCNKTITTEEMESMENTINKKIHEKISLEKKVLPLDEAKNQGYCFLKNTYYENDVSCVNVGDWSKELCHGTHVDNTEELIGFKIIKKKSISAGVIRFECITGDEYNNWKNQTIVEEKIQENLLINEYIKDKIYIGVWEKMDHLLHDKYKFKYDYVVLLNPQGGIIIASEQYKIDNILDLLKEDYEIKGSSKEKLFRGKIMDLLDIDLLINKIKSILK
jgi:alanyl-tRNA synthetase